MQFNQSSSFNTFVTFGLQPPLHFALGVATCYCAELTQEGQCYFGSHWEHEPVLAYPSLDETAVGSGPLTTWSPTELTRRSQPQRARLSDTRMSPALC